MATKNGPASASNRSAASATDSSENGPKVGKGAGSAADDDNPEKLQTTLPAHGRPASGLHPERVWPD